MKVTRCDRSQWDGYQIAPHPKRLGQPGGATRESINKTVRDMRQKGRTDMEQGRITIPDAEALKAWIAA